ncbi:DNA-formamidopyrimidine glycosylase family protein [Agromyces sp. Soil535]|uniref:DNA-formamidopyrimidine glycosylase family protein n=1 Tax=Agromyces sp. Soil535 TaxID=1736390 RepID=UPI0006FCBF5F|nr:DNA-formamidopyrimidine glycosylase family protein [Agromyces sp. Soil535]KRE21574.1 formamidopyrimidine-DNA glycosylase [Agromyces sp. Soil535]
MPESPEVQALVDDLGTRLTGREIRDVDVVEFRVTKTRARPLATLTGERVTSAARRGKHLDLAAGTSQHLVVTLGRHGWARYRGADGQGSDGQGSEGDAGDAPPTLVAFTFDDGRVLELTDAGDWVSLGCWVVDDPAEVPAVAKLGPDPAHPDFSRAEFDRVVVGRRKQVKAVLQEQESLAGIGNAYSDEILHAAKISPLAHAASLTSAELGRLFDATVRVVSEAIDAQRGVPIDQLKAAKVAAMRVHGRAGEACPVCGDTICDFSFASTTAQYCPTCQTRGERLPLRPA